MFSEKGVTAHLYLFIAGVVALILFITYAFVYDHKEKIYGDEQWEKALTKAGLSDAEIEKISHDEDVWYYGGVSTCVSYGDWKDRCKKFEAVCAGKGEVYGSADQQAEEIAKALDHEGVHPECPLVFSGGK